MNILNKSISSSTPHGSSSMWASQQNQVKKTDTVSIGTSNTPALNHNKNMQFFVRNPRHSGVLELNDTEDALMKISLFNKDSSIIPNHILDLIREGEEKSSRPRDDIDMESFAFGFVQSMIENKQISVIGDKVSIMDDLLHGDRSEYGSGVGTHRTNTQVVMVASAVKLDQRQMDQIAKKMKRITGSADVKLQNTIDKSLIAGFVISYEKEGLQVIDLSVKGQLDELKNHLESKDQKMEHIR